MAGSHEVRGSIPLGSTTYYASRTIIVRLAFFFRRTRGVQGVPKPVMRGL